MNQKVEQIVFLFPIGNTARNHLLLECKVTAEKNYRNSWKCNDQIISMCTTLFHLLSKR